MNSPLLELLREKAFEKRDLILASGRPSNFYMDVKRVSLMAAGAYHIGQELFALIRNEFPDAEGIGGLTLGADPLATAVAYASFVAKHPLDGFIVRKEIKAHGTGKLIEGGFLLKPLSKVVVLEDVVTSGGSSLEAVRKIRDHGWTVIGIAAVVDREEGARQALEKEGLRLYSLYQKTDFGTLE